MRRNRMLLPSRSGSHVGEPLSAQMSQKKSWFQMLRLKKSRFDDRPLLNKAKIFENWRAQRRKAPVIVFYQIFTWVFRETQSWIEDELCSIGVYVVFFGALAYLLRHNSNIKSNWHKYSYSHIAYRYLRSAKKKTSQHRYITVKLFGVHRTEDRANRIIYFVKSFSYSFTSTYQYTRKKKTARQEQQTQG